QCTTPRLTFCECAAVGGMMEASLLAETVMEHEYDYLIIGAGMAADAAAKALGDADPDARVGILGDETHAPYERPPLTKGLWTENDKKPADAVDLGTAAKGADLHLGRQAVSLDTTSRSVDDDPGASWLY